MANHSVLSQPGRTRVAWFLLLIGLVQACAPEPLNAGERCSSEAPLNDDAGEQPDANLAHGSDANSSNPSDAGTPEQRREPEDAGTRPEPPQVDEDAAEVVEFDRPEHLNCGERSEMSIVVRNTGRAVWTRAAGYKLGAAGDNDPFIDGTRVGLSDEDRVEPGETHNFRFQIQAPDEAGRYTSDWRMVHEDIRWFGEQVDAEIRVECEERIVPARALPNMAHVVRQVAAERPDLLRAACAGNRAHWGFLDLLVDRLREHDDRWGFNWKRGVVGDASRDCVDYHWGDGAREGSTEVYIIDVIRSCSSQQAAPAWGDQTEATARAGTIGRWTSRGRF